MLAGFAVLGLAGVGGVEWWDAQQLGVRGRGFSDDVLSSWSDRLPAAAQSKVRTAVWSLSRDSAGLHLDFYSNATQLHVNVTYRYSTYQMWHFPSTGVAGLDLYGWDSKTSAWRWMATTHTNTATNTLNILDASPDASQPDGMRRYRLNLPTYNSPVALRVGAEPGQIQVAKDKDERGPVVWYGTSIAQGACASRPGQAFTNRVMREINRTVLNFGFSGNCLMEESVTDFITNTTIAPALFIIDCSWNMQASQITERAVPLTQRIRSQLGPNVPIILAEETTAGGEWMRPSNSAQKQKWAALRKAFDQLSPSDPNLHYVKHEDLYNFPYDSDGVIQPTVGDTHPSDLGQKAVADYYIGFLPGLLKKGGERRVVQKKAVLEARSLDFDTSGEDEDRIHNATVEASFAAESAGAAAVDIRWVDVESELGVINRAFNDTHGYYTRLPKAAKGVVRDAVWELSLMSTGLGVAFVTNGSCVYVNYTLAKPPAPLWHMSDSGTSGMDLFRWDDSVKSYRFLNTVSTFPGTTIETALFCVDDPTPARYLLNLPLRNQVVRMAVGVPQGATVSRDPAWSPASKGGILWYGTSIDQGGVASRPGSTYTNILSRGLGREVWNLGFAGNGKMELNVAEFLVKVPADIVVIDCLPNLGVSGVSSSTGPLVRYLRQNGFNNTPIVLAAGTTYGEHWFAPAANDNKRAALKAEYDKLIAAGDKNLHLVLNTNDELFASDPLVNPTVGGTHPSDLGHREIANFYFKYLPTLMP
eukprot:Hpha_TRINITY_DN11965_c0_g2::TRINITY_DN11965_c0_g2_i1::g.20445::m.20445